MSIADKITRLANARTAIQTAISNKGGTVTSADGFEDFSEAIGTISIDPSGGTTAVAGDLLSGKTAYSNHNLITGTIPTYTNGITNPPIGPSNTEISVTYDGTEKDNGYTTPTNVTMTGTNKSTDAGIFTATYDVNDGYVWSDGTIANKTITLNVNKMSLVKPSLTQSIYNYTGSPVTPTLDNFNSTHETKSGTTSATEIGNYTITASLNSITNTQWLDSTTAPLNLNWSIIGNGKFVCVGQNGASYYSTDGINWTPMTGLNTEIDYKCVSYCNNAFYCVSEFDGGTSKIYKSLDGETWTHITGLMDIYETPVLSYGNNTYVCLSTYLPYYSYNGTEWFDGDYWEAGSDLHVSFGNNKFISVNDEMYIQVGYSTDGQNWSFFEPEWSRIDDYGSNIIYANNKFTIIGVDTQSTKVIFTIDTVDGINYTSKRNIDNSYGSIALNFKQSIAYGNGKYVIVGYDNTYGCKAYSSNDCITWTTMTGLTSSTPYSQVAYTNNTFVCTSENGQVAYSTNGTSWTEISGFRTGIYALTASLD